MLENITHGTSERTGYIQLADDLVAARRADAKQLAHVRMHRRLVRERQRRQLQAQVQRQALGVVAARDCQHMARLDARHPALHQPVF